MKKLTNKNEICFWLDENNILDYELIADDTHKFLINVNGDVDLTNRGLTILPVQFGKIFGSFDLSYNKLINLNGSPKFVEDNFSCSYNSSIYLTLQGCPKVIMGDFYLYSNIENFLYFPDEIGGKILLSNDNYYSFNELFKLHLKDKSEYEKQLLNKCIKFKNIDKNINSFKI